MTVGSKVLLMIFSSNRSVDCCGLGSSDRCCRRPGHASYSPRLYEEVSVFRNTALVCAIKVAPETTEIWLAPAVLTISTGSQLRHSQMVRIEDCAYTRRGHGNLVYAAFFLPMSLTKLPHFNNQESFPC